MNFSGRILMDFNGRIFGVLLRDLEVKVSRFWDEIVVNFCKWFDWYDK